VQQATISVGSAAPAPVSTINAGNTLPNGAAPILRWQGPALLKVGDTFALQLLMQSDQPVVSVPLALTFDPRVLQVASVAEGEFLRQGGAQTAFTSRIDPNGQILLTGTRSGETGATALGTIATINFRVAAAVPAESQIQLLTIAPIGLGGRSIFAPVPPPHLIQIGAN
jgi:general secretion pathway protein D